MHELNCVAYCTLMRFRSDGCRCSIDGMVGIYHQFRTHSTSGPFCHKINGTGQIIMKLLEKDMRGLLMALNEEITDMQAVEDDF